MLPAARPPFTPDAAMAACRRFSLALPLTPTTPQPPVGGPLFLLKKRPYEERLKDLDNFSVSTREG